MIWCDFLLKCRSSNVHRNSSLAYLKLCVKQKAEDGKAAASGHSEMHFRNQRPVLGIMPVRNPTGSSFNRFLKNRCVGHCGAWMKENDFCMCWSGTGDPK